MNELLNQNLFSDIKELIIDSRKKIVQTVNTTMVYTYFEIGRLIVENLQDGKDRASYGKQVLKLLSEQLTKEFGKGFSEHNLLNFKMFYQIYSIPKTLSAEFRLDNSSHNQRKSMLREELPLQNQIILNISEDFKLIATGFRACLKSEKFYKLPACSFLTYWIHVIYVFECKQGCMHNTNFETASIVRNLRINMEKTRDLQEAFSLLEVPYW